VAAAALALLLCVELLGFVDLAAALAAAFAALG
jgi:hypothetical protein